jgi:hypothetical protein
MNTGCFAVKEALVPEGRTAPVVVIEQQNPLTNCDPARPNGQLSATADNGQVGGYTFDWYAGTTATGTIIQPNLNILIGQTTGSYTAHVTNNITGCPADKTGDITPNLVIPPTPTPVLVQNRTHCIFPDGWVSASVDGVILNYFFNWYDSEASGVQGAPDFIGVDYTKRDIGPYSVTAMDIETGCVSLPAQIDVGDERLTPELVFRTTASFCADVPSEIGGSGTIEIQLVPANALVDSVAWINLEDNSSAGSGSYITGLYPGFYQADVMTVKGCTASGQAEVKTEVLAYNLVTRNGDQKNDKFVVDCISRFKDNNVKIFNRSGVLVYEATGYNNDDVVFQGVGEKGVYTTGTDLPVGTYFYIIDKRDGSKPKTGYLELVK